MMFTQLEGTDHLGLRVVAVLVIILTVATSNAVVAQNVTTAMNSTDSTEENSSVVTDVTATESMSSMEVTTPTSGGGDGSNTPQMETTEGPPTTQQITNSSSDDGQTTGAPSSNMSSTTDSGDGSTSSSPGIRCFTCFTNTTDSCYGEQTADGNEVATCNYGELCWTVRYNNAGEFTNLTRECLPKGCNALHVGSGTYCEEAQGIEECTQCCSEDLCNKHTSAESGGVGGLSASLSGVLLSLVALLEFTL